MKTESKIKYHERKLKILELIELCNYRIELHSNFITRNKGIGVKNAMERITICESIINRLELFYEN